MGEQPDIRFYCDKAADMELIVCNCSQVSYPLHNHVSVFTAGMILDGAVTVATAHGERLCRGGDLFVISPYMPHELKARKRYTLLSLCIGRHAFDGCSSGAVRSRAMALLRQAPDIKHIDGRRLSRLVDCLCLCAQAPSWQGNSGLDGPRKLLEMHPERKLNVEELARSAYMSKFHFIRSFKREVGLTPHQFQLQNRVRKAQRLLGRTGTVAEAALTAGFCDQSHFIRQFERIVGLTPSFYKRACTETKTGSGG